MYEIEPIGFFKTEEKEKYSVCRQPGLIKSAQGKIVLNRNSNFEQALKDLNGFSHIFVIYRFHRNHSWKPMVLPPRGEKKRGLFATRAPNRPNFLGLSCLEIVSIKGLTIYVDQHDLLDGTPIFDIKPYLTYTDCFPNAKQGWLEELQEEPLFEVKATDEVQETLDLNPDILQNMLPRLRLYPYPKKQNRIRDLNNGMYEIAYKTWRARYRVSLNPHTVHLDEIYNVNF